MLSIRTFQQLDHTLSSLLDPELRRLLSERRTQLSQYDGYDLAELAHLLVAQRGDELAAVEAEAGVPLATNLVDGSALGERDFRPSFEYVERHGNWWEATLILSDDGFGVVLFVQDQIDTDPALLALMRSHV